MRIQRCGCCCSCADLSSDDRQPLFRDGVDWVKTQWIDVLLQSKHVLDFSADEIAAQREQQEVRPCLRTCTGTSTTDVVLRSSRRK